MPTQVQFRRGTTAQNNNFTGAEGEITVNTSNNTIRVHDGATQGGFELATVAHVTNSIANVIDSAPGVLDTLNEIAIAINNDPAFYTNLASTNTTIFNRANAAYNQANTATTIAVAAFDSSNTKVATVAGSSATNISNTILLDGIKAVDGTGSGLDADLLDGLHATVFAKTTDLTTANVNEVTNLYFTTARARTSLSQGSGISYNSSTGVISANVISVAGRVGAVTLRNTDIAGLTTANVTELTNLYYTDARVYANVVAGSFTTKTYVDNSIANIVSSAPATLDTLNELAAALGDDPNFATTTANLIGEARNQANAAYNQANAATTNASTATIIATAAFDSGNTKVATVAGVTSTAISNTNVLDGIKTVDGTGSGLDADLLDGLQATAFAKTTDLTTANVAELTNLYFTTARARTSLSQGSGISYNSSTGVISANVTSVAGRTGAVTLTNTDITGLTTANVTELTNLYFTNARSYANIIQLGYITSSALNGYATNAQLTSYATTANLTLAFNQANTATTIATAAFDSGNTKVATVAGVTATAISNANLLDGIKAVDGSGSGLDADLLDGLSGGGAGAYALKANNLSVFAATTSAQLASIISDKTGSGNLVFSNSPAFTGTVTAVDIAATGNVTAPNLYAYSDEKLKTDFEPILNAIEKVLALNGYYFTWIDSNQRSMGLKAQQVELVEPVVVATDENGIKSVNYMALTGLLIEAIKAQQEQINTLKNRIEKL